jgi:hypothetical protein
MASYRIVCVNTAHPHRHITNVGTGPEPARASQIWAVTQVRSMMDKGDTFHTISPFTGRRAEVRADNCNIDGCVVRTIRSHSDAVKDNNLDSLRKCNT